MSDYTGTWVSDPIHSSVEFSARHNVVSVFRGQIGDFTATVTGDGDNLSLTGVATVDSIVTKDDNLNAHLRSPEFFDMERNPEVRLQSTGFRRDGDTVTFDVDLTMAGITRPATLSGTVTGPVEGAFGGTLLGLELQGTVDRTEWNMNWNAPMPGGDLMLSKDVKLTAHLELVKQ